MFMEDLIEGDYLKERDLDFGGLDGNNLIWLIMNVIKIY